MAIDMPRTVLVGVVALIVWLTVGGVLHMGPCSKA